MSYILDALTKAAQQRERQVPVVQRLLSAAPAQGASWPRVPRRLMAALAVSALPAIALVVWLRSAPSPAPMEPAAPALSASAPRAPSVEVARPVKVEPSPRPEIPTAKPAPAERAASAVAPTVAPKPKVPSAPPAAPRSPAAVVPAPSSAAAAPAPPPAAAPPTPAEKAALKLEALIYSDVPAQRMVFINGRRYAEGEMVDGRLRVEEIQEDGVALSDQGRRFTLRVAR